MQVKVKTGEKRHFLIKEDNNWADEIDIQAMKLDVGYVDLKTYKENFIKDIEDSHGNYPFEASIGTNEDIEYENRSDVEGSLEFKEITEEEYNTLKKFLGTSFGTSALI